MIDLQGTHDAGVSTMIRKANIRKMQVRFKRASHVASGNLVRAYMTPTTTLHLQSLQYSFLTLRSATGARTSKIRSTRTTVIEQARPVVTEA